MEYELKEMAPILYYGIWDSTPVPYFNKNFYESFDKIMSISKLSRSVHYSVVNKIDKNITLFTCDGFKKKTKVTYVPHGIDENKFFPVSKKVRKDFQLKYFGEDLERKYDFIGLYNGRNIPRKNLANLLMGFSSVMYELTLEERKKRLLIMHTNPYDLRGANLVKIVEDLIQKDCNIMFFQTPLEVDELNVLYNVADLTVNVSHLEGFGLTTAESLMAGTSMMATATGGLNDQMGTDKDGYAGV